MTLNEALEVIDIAETEDPEMSEDFREALFTVAAEVRALRQRHAEAVEAAFKEGRSSDQRAQDDAAWLASEAKKGLEYTPDGPRIRQIVCEVPEKKQ
jgi:hypothetical protein